ncbi:SDR family oxidoreductase [Proteobacteria bacterium 005FR1]|nr:SDR family oxidoreductase [Proteobacteria bacterium 005FR1]
MAQRLNDKVAVITGAGSGIGRGLATVLSQRGCKLALSDVNEVGLAETAASLGGDVFTQVVDVADRAAMFAHAERVIERFGAVDLVINNAGVTVSQTLAEVSFEDFEWLMNINFWGVVYGTKAFLPGMIERNSGTIVNISSVFGLVGWPTQGTYCAAKFAVRGFTETLRHELADTGIKVVSVHPGGVNTNIARNARFYADQAGGRDHDEMVEAFAKLAKTTPLQAAEQIVSGIEKGRERVLPGDGARMFDWLQRMRPVGYYRSLAALGKRLGEKK